MECLIFFEHFSRFNEEKTLFSIEALKADHGDALFVHYGPEDNPKTIMVDGGPHGVFEDAILPRIEQMLEFRELDQLKIRLAMVSHIDNDHIIGINDLLKHIEEEEDGALVDLEGLWHNSFDDSIDTAELEMLADLGGTSNSVAASLGMSHFLHDITAGVFSGKRLRDQANDLGLVVNSGADLNPNPGASSLARVTESTLIMAARCVF